MNLIMPRRTFTQRSVTFRRDLPRRLLSSSEMTKRVVNAKIACLDFSLQKTKLKMGVQVIITDPEKLDQIRQRSVFPVRSRSHLNLL